MSSIGMKSRPKCWTVLIWRPSLKQPSKMIKKSRLVASSDPTMSSASSHWSHPGESVNLPRHEQGVAILKSNRDALPAHLLEAADLTAACAAPVPGMSTMTSRSATRRLWCLTSWPLVRRVAVMDDACCCLGATTLLEMSTMSSLFSLFVVNHV